MVVAAHATTHYHTSSTAQKTVITHSIPRASSPSFVVAFSRRCFPTREKSVAARRALVLTHPTKRAEKPPCSCWPSLLAGSASPPGAAVRQRKKTLSTRGRRRGFRVRGEGATSHRPSFRGKGVRRKSKMADFGRSTGVPSFFGGARWKSITATRGTARVGAHNPCWRCGEPATGFSFLFVQCVSSINILRLRAQHFRGAYFDVYSRPLRTLRAQWRARDERAGLFRPKTRAPVLLK